MAENVTHLSDIKAPLARIGVRVAILMGILTSGALAAGMLQLRAKRAGFAVAVGLAEAVAVLVVLAAHWDETWFIKDVMFASSFAACAVFQAGSMLAYAESRPDRVSRAGA